MKEAIYFKRKRERTYEKNKIFLIIVLLRIPFYKLCDLKWGKEGGAKKWGKETAQCTYFHNQYLIMYVIEYCISTYDFHYAFEGENNYFTTSLS